MFVQLIFGETTDPAALQGRFEEWVRDLSPGAPGWLGAVGGTTTQGPFCSAVLFDSEESARANSDRVEQGEWWKGTEAHFTGPVTFVDSADVAEFTAAGHTPGARSSAGFVQMMRARCRDRARLEALEDEVESLFQEWRPDLIGGLRVWEADDRVIAVDYFTSEAEARAGEATAPPPGLPEKFEEWQGLLSDVEWFDLTQPWHFGPGS